MLSLPIDTLVWEDHVDCVTGLAAGETGGHSRTLRLKYFALKHMDGRPDILIIEHQWVPHRFHELIAKAIDLALEAMRELRAVLVAQHANSSLNGGSDLRIFKVNDGTTVTSADLLFLNIIGSAKPKPDVIAESKRIGTCNSNLLSRKLGRTENQKHASFFRVYGEELSEGNFGLELAELEDSINSHQFRHLLNTEFFRLNVPDTVITHQFGRKSVAQSYAYFHPTLEEKFDFVTLPEGLDELFPSGSPQEHVAKNGC